MATTDCSDDNAAQRRQDDEYQQRLFLIRGIPFLENHVQVYAPEPTARLEAPPDFCYRGVFQSSQHSKSCSSFSCPSSSAPSSSSSSSPSVSRGAVCMVCLSKMAQSPTPHAGECIRCDLLAIPTTQCSAQVCTFMTPTTTTNIVYGEFSIYFAIGA